MKLKTSKSIVAVVTASLIVVMLIAAGAAWYFNIDPAATGWWSTEVSPSGDVYECFTVVRTDSSGISVNCWIRP